MSARDRELGMDRAITRRDFLNGFSLAVGGSLALSGSFWTEAFGSPASPLDLQKASEKNQIADQRDGIEPQGKDNQDRVHRMPEEINFSSHSEVSSKGLRAENCR